MRPPRNSALCLFAALFTLLPFTAAKPLILEASERDLQLQNSSLARRCENPCGYYGQVCCAWNQPCYTDSNNEAQCGAATTPVAAGSSGYWQYYTTIFVETDTESHTTTQTYSSFIPSPAGPTMPASTETLVEAKCNWSAGESTCGNICCPSGQYCVVDGQCSGNTRTITKTASQTVGPPLRPTSSGLSTITQTFATTTTVPFLAPVSTGQSMNITEASSTGSSSLSGGAIAGIVIAVILGILLLLLLCAFFCFKALWDSILAIFGLGKYRRRETIIEESVHRSSRGDREWYGDRPARVEKTSNNRNYFGPMAAGLGGLAVALGMKQRNDRRKRRVVEEKDVYVEDDVSYSRDSRTISEESSDRRTRDSRRSAPRSQARSQARTARTTRTETRRSNN